MELENIMFSEISQKKKKKIVYLISYMWSLNSET